jgi:RNA polymerase sigma-70 factor (sigma-E family)
MSTAPVETPAPHVPWDEDLVRVYRERYDGLVRLAYLVSGERDRAEEVVQEAFLKTHRSWARVREPLPYLRQAVVNGCRSVGRRQQLERARLPRPADPATQQPDELWDALATLPDRQRTAVVLRYYVDLPDTEIAGILDCRPATVRTTIHRALARLRQEIAR